MPANQHERASVPFSARTDALWRLPASSYAYSRTHRRRNEALSTTKRIRTRAQGALGIPKAEIRGVYVVASVSAATPWGKEGRRDGEGGGGTKERRCGKRVLGDWGGCSGTWAGGRTACGVV